MCLLLEKNSSPKGNKKESWVREGEREREIPSSLSDAHNAMDAPRSFILIFS
jgi:hypothetical protein